MKKILGFLLSFVAFFFVFSSKVDAVDYGSDRGYSYSPSATKFYYITDHNDITSITLNIDSVDPIVMEVLAQGIYYYDFDHNTGGDLREKEYYYTICYSNSVCKDAVDPFAPTVNEYGDRNVILDTKAFAVEGWDTVKTEEVKNSSKSIYAIEADKFVEQLTTSSIVGATSNDSVFTKLVSNTKYSSQTYESSSFLTGYRYLEQSRMKYLEVGNLYDENNYFFPNTQYSSSIEKYSPISEYQNFIIGYKNIRMNVIARMDLLTPGENLRESLLAFSNNYISNGKINLTNSVMQEYIKDVYKTWLRNYKVDGFYIVDASSYGTEFLNSLITELKEINSNVFIYTDSKDYTEYHLNNDLQTALFGSLDNINDEGILNGNYTEENFNKLVNAMYGGYYSDQSKYKEASKVINNIGSLSGLDIYSKIKILEGLSARESVILNKMQVGLYTIFASTGIPRVVAGNEFYNNTTIPISLVDATDSSLKECIPDTKLCYSKGEAKTIDWGNLLNNSTKMSEMINYRGRLSHQYPSSNSMMSAVSVSYDSSLIQKGILLLVIEYEADYEGDKEKSIMLVNYSGEDVEISAISDREYGKVISLVGKVEQKEESTKVSSYTFFTFTEIKVNKIPNWVYIVVTACLFIFIFVIRTILIKLLKNKKGINYSEYMNEQKRINKENKKKKIKVKEPGIYETYLAKDPIFQDRKKKEKVKKEKKNPEKTEAKEDVDTTSEKDKK